MSLERYPNLITGPSVCVLGEVSQSNNWPIGLCPWRGIPIYIITGPSVCVLGRIMPTQLLATHYMFQEGYSQPNNWLCGEGYPQRKKMAMWYVFQKGYPSHIAQYMGIQHVSQHVSTSTDS